MSGGGFARHMIETFKKNRAIKTSQKKNKLQAGKNIDGKKPVRFKKANRATKKIIYYDKQKLEKQMRFRIGLVLLIAIFVLLLLLLFLNFG